MAARLARLHHLAPHPASLLRIASGWGIFLLGALWLLAHGVARVQTFTLPVGTDYTMISIAPVMELPAIDNINGNTESGACKYCGKVHPGHLWGRLVALVHAIIYFFMHLFGRM